MTSRQKSTVVFAPRLEENDVTEEITGKTLIGWGFEPANWFGQAIQLANQMSSSGADEKLIIEAVTVIDMGHTKREGNKLRMREHHIPFSIHMGTPKTLAEVENSVAVFRSMEDLMRVPTVKKGAVMPDACPAGVIPVGGIVACEDAIHPHYHSSDVCCSMALTTFDVEANETNLAEALDWCDKLTHFGPKQFSPSAKRVGEMSRDLVDLVNGEPDHATQDFDNNDPVCDLLRVRRIVTDH